MLTDCYRAEMQKRGVCNNLDEITTERIGKVSRWLVNGNKPGLMLFGTVGNGKTTMAGAVCTMIGIIHDSAFQSECKSVRKITAPGLVELKLTDEVKYESLKNAEMLFVDDLGTESVSVKSYGNEMTPVIDLLYHRYDRQLFTILTSNLTRAGIGELYGERLADRFNELFDAIAYTNPSYRK